MQLSGFLVKQQGTKLIESAPDMPYPALWSIWGKANLSGVDFTPERDDLLVKSIKRYILKSDKLMYDIESKLRSALAKYPQVIVWGTGQLAMKLLAETSLANAQIVAFVDGNPVNHGKILRGVPNLGARGDWGNGSTYYCDINTSSEGNCLQDSSIRVIKQGYFAI